MLYRLGLVLFKCKNGTFIFLCEIKVAIFMNMLTTSSVSLFRKNEEHITSCN